MSVFTPPASWILPAVCRHARKNVFILEMLHRNLLNKIIEPVVSEYASHMSCFFGVNRYPLASLPGHRVPKFGAMQIGKRLMGRIKVCTRCSVDPEFRSCKQAVTAKVSRNHVFLPVESSAVKGETHRCDAVSHSSASTSRRRSVVTSPTVAPGGANTRQGRGGNRQWIGNPTDGRMRGQTEEENLEVVSFSDTAPFVLQHAALRMYCNYSCTREYNTRWLGRPVTLDLILASEKLIPEEVAEASQTVKPMFAP